jgi:hypothetical protein
MSSMTVLPSTTIFPATSPVVSFCGTVAGSGDALLNDNSLLRMSPDERRCSGFVQCSSYITPGNKGNSLRKNSHAFQVFILLPISVKPFDSRWSRYKDGKDSKFKQDNVVYCTGKVVGVLDRELMVSPSPSENDVVFVVVPDTLEIVKESMKSGSFEGLSPNSNKGKAAATSKASQFLSTPKRDQTQRSTETTPSGPSKKRQESSCKAPCTSQRYSHTE